jgi:glycosyltransferase involved in cell wall biosynthesis
MEEMIHSFRKLGHEVVVLDTKSGSGVLGESCRGSGTDARATDEKSPGVAMGNRSTKPDASSAGAMPRGLRVLLRDGYYLLHNFSFYSRVAAILKEQPSFDFIYERYYIYQFSTSMAARKWGVPLILEFNASIDEMKLTDGLGLRAIAAGVEKRVTARADAIVAVSGVVKRQLAGLGLSPEKIHVLHNGVNLEKFYPREPAKEIRERFRLSSDDVVVGFVGGFSVWHGVHLLHDVAPLAIRENGRLRFLMVGGREGNPRFEAFRHKVKEQGLEDSFRFAGEIPREDVPGHVAAMDIAIIPWATEYGSPTKTFEYMAMAKALVAPRVAALEEVLEHEKTALLVAAGDVRGTADALVSLASNPELRTNLGKGARRAVEEKYNWDRNAEATLDIARRVMDARRRGA